MTCTTVEPCLSSGSAKNNKIICMFDIFSRLFGDFESLAFFRKQSSRAGCCWTIFDGMTISNDFSKCD